MIFTKRELIKLHRHFRSRPFSGQIEHGKSELMFKNLVDKHTIHSDQKKIHHALIRRILHKIRDEFPKMDNNIILKLAVQAMNDTIGPEGLIHPI